MSKAKQKAVRVVPEDIDAAVQEAVQRAPGSTGSQLVKVLPASYRPFAKEVTATAERLAASNRLYRHSKTKSTLVFFPLDPLATLDESIPTRLAGGARSKGDLKKLIAEVAPGHDTVLDAWLKQALARRILYEHAPSTKGAPKLYGTEPDLRKLAAPALTAIRKVIASLDAREIPRQRLADLLLQEIGASKQTGSVSSDHPQHAAGANGDARALFLRALAGLGAEHPRQALLSVRELRARLRLEKERFDTLALQLMRDGVISLHHHDHPTALPELERAQLVQDARGTFYVGIAPRSGS